MWVAESSVRAFSSTALTEKGCLKAEVSVRVAVVVMRSMEVSLPAAIAGEAVAANSTA